jgi:hypothetical protein
METATEQQLSNELRSIREIIKDLSKPIAGKHLKTRQQGGTTLKYIAWYDAIKYLDHYAPGWSYEIVAVWNDEKFCIVKVRITIPCAEGVVSREATGVEELTSKGYGDYVSNACSMALRRAAALYGLGIGLYEH